VQADAPLEKLPLFVRAGSIVPMGPKMEWTTEKPADPIVLRFYPGADGDFVLYEDENDGYAYEKGAHATIALHWEDRIKTLTISPREGSFPGMLKERIFKVVLVKSGHGVGIGETEGADVTFNYTGSKSVSSFSGNGF
jgi:alpha-D-xyloside xylohydrolase